MKYGVRVLFDKSLYNLLGNEISKQLYKTEKRLLLES